LKKNNKNEKEQKIKIAKITPRFCEQQDFEKKLLNY